MKAETTGKEEITVTDRPYLCCGYGAVWLAELDDDEGFVCVDPLESNFKIGEYSGYIVVDKLFDGKVTLSNN